MARGFNGEKIKNFEDSEAACERGIQIRPSWTLLRPTSWTMSILLNWTADFSNKIIVNSSDTRNFPMGQTILSLERN